MNTNQITFEEDLTTAVHHQFNQCLTLKSYNCTPLHGGTLGTVQRINGIALTTEGSEVPFSLVHKLQKKWKRNFDESSWRREYDLYMSGMDQLFTEALRWPKCYHASITEEELQLWTEYIAGASGLALTVDMFERAAEELGRFQGRIHSLSPSLRDELPNLSSLDFMKKNYQHYRSWPEVYDYIRDENCPIPKHLCRMLIEIDEREDEVWQQIEKLPVVLCHRDFWITNIFYTKDNIRLIDWDTSGWGYLGEDIASLIADEADITKMEEYYLQCVSAYYRGFSEYVDRSAISDPLIIEMMLIKYGYRLVEWYKFAETEDEKQLQIDTLQKIYELKEKLLSDDILYSL